MNCKIKALLVRKDIKQTDIAASLNVTPGMVCGVIGGKHESHRVKQAIADALKMPYCKVWGKKA